MAGDPSADAASTPQAAPRRKFAIEPVETTSRSSKTEREKKQEVGHKKEEEEEAAKPRRRFLPQPVEETTRSSRRGGSSRNGEDHRNEDDAGAAAKANGTAEKKPRKFAVEPVETVKRVRRRNSSGPTLQPGDATDESLGDASARRRNMNLEVPSIAPMPPANSPDSLGDAAPQVPESRFSYANLARKASRTSSMRKPTLEPISSVPESEESNFSKRSSSSNSSAHEDAEQLKVPRRKRQLKQKESYEEGFSGYLLDMAARAAQQQLREQVAEAYPNERLYEPVDHFAVDRESDSDPGEANGQLPEAKIEEPGDGREQAAGWDPSEFRRHREKLRQQKQEQLDEDQKNASKLQLPKPDPTRVSPATPKKDPFGNAFNLSAVGADPPHDPEMSRMQDKARPPMLGHSLVFPKCQSPRVTLIDPLQRHGTRQNTGVVARRGSGLWTPEGELSPVVKHRSPQSSVCLWGGNCTADQAAKMRVHFPANMQTGIMTPQYAPDEDPFERYANDESLQNAQVTVQMQQQQMMKQKNPAAAARSQHQLPSNPGSRVHSILGIDQLLAIEQRLEQEYPDAFVTQIYNYLSLGYPAIARSYDEELSRISKVPIEEIRRDDARKNTKGYVGAPEGNGISETSVREECGRWRALSLYIREWARQQPNMMDDGADASWGARARRGSWFA